MIVVLAEGHGNVAVALCGLWEGLTNIVRAMIINRDCVRVWAQSLWLLLTQSKHLETYMPAAGRRIYSDGFAACLLELKSISRPILYVRWGSLVGVSFLKKRLSMGLYMFIKQIWGNTYTYYSFVETHADFAGHLIIPSLIWKHLCLLLLPLPWTWLLLPFALT